MHAICLGLVLIFASTSLSYADEKWIAASRTANSITGDITLVGDTIVFANGDSMAIVPIAGSPGAFAVDPPVAPAPLGNPLCGRASPLTRVELSASGGILSMKVFDDEGFCGLYNYQRAASTGAGPDSGPARGSVLWAQQKLNALGYDAGPEDGAMGPRTRAALAAFQRDYWLPVTSGIDSGTISALDAPDEWDAAVPVNESGLFDMPEGERISILGVEYPTMPAVSQNDIPAEWEDVRPYIPEWLHAARDEQMDDAARLRFLQEFAGQRSVAYEAALKEAADLHFPEFNRETPEKSREYLEFVAAEMCIANDSGGYIPDSTLALCQEFMALDFLIHIVHVASGIERDPAAYQKGVAVARAARKSADEILRTAADQQAVPAAEETE